LASEASEPNVFDVEIWKQKQEEVVHDLKLRVPGVVVNPFEYLLESMEAMVFFTKGKTIENDQVAHLPHGAKLKIGPTFSVLRIPMVFTTNPIPKWTLVSTLSLLVAVIHASLYACAWYTTKQLF
jgi:hypothetical protein